MASRLGFTFVAVACLAAGLAVGRWRSTPPSASAASAPLASSGEDVDGLRQDQRRLAEAIGALSVKVDALGRAPGPVSTTAPTPAPDGEGSSPAAPALTEADVAAHVDEARAFISKAIDSGGRWRREDELQFRALLATIPGEQLHEVHRELIVALNSGKLKPEMPPAPSAP